MSARVCIMRKQTHSINVCVCELVFESLHAIDTFTKRNSVNKQRDRACKQDINRILLDLDSLGFESFGFGILNCPSLVLSTNFVGYFSDIDDLGMESVWIHNSFSFNIPRLSDYDSAKDDFIDFRDDPRMKDNFERAGMNVKQF